MGIPAIINRIATALGVTTAAFLTVAAAPAQAEQRPSADTDGEFSQLFSHWEAMDSAGTKSVPIVSVAVPSRMPLDSAKLTSEYGMRTHPVLGGRRQHKGIDLASPTGTPIYATADGVVSKAEWFGGYGNYIQIEHGAELETRYGHLSQYAVVTGQRVSKGDLIGYVGSTGRSTGPHLHYEVRVAGEAVNPTPYMVETTAAQAFALARGRGGEGGPE